MTERTESSVQKAPKPAAQAVKKPAATADPPSEPTYEELGELPSEATMGRNEAAHKLVEFEWRLWRDRPLKLPQSAVARRQAMEFEKRAVDVFKLRYLGDNRLTRWFGETRLVDYEMRRRKAYLGRQADRDAVGMSPLTPLRIVAAVLAVLVLLALVGAVVFALVDCSADAPLTSTTSASTDATTTDSSSAAPTNASTTGATTADLRACKRFDDVWVWHNCSAECLPVGYSSKPASSAGGGCKRARWQACYGPTACSNSSAHADKPIDKLNCTQASVRFSRLHKDADTYECPAANTTYCHVFADGAGHTLYYGCYGPKFKLANSDVGCGKTIPNGECRFVLTNKTNDDGVKLNGQLCCCYGDACNNKTLAQLAVNKTEAVSTCVAGLETKTDRGLVESLDNYTSTQHNCTLGDICVDVTHFASGQYQHSRGCNFSGNDVVIGIQQQCAQQLHRYNSTCFKAQDGKTEYGVCCCSGDNCTADNSFHYLYNPDNTTRDKCDYEYALVDGVPDDDDGGGAQVVDGCEAVLARVPAATDACELLGDGCFVTHDGDGKDVSVCCCLGVGCTPKDVHEFVANKQPATTQPTTTQPTTTRAPTDASTSTAATSEAATSEAAAATTGASDEATGGCRWVAVCFAVLFALLLVALLPVAYILFQFLRCKENGRWMKLQDKVRCAWADDTFKAGIMACIDGMPGVTGAN